MLVVMIGEVYRTYELVRDPIAGILHPVWYATAAAMSTRGVERWVMGNALQTITCSPLHFARAAKSRLRYRQATLMQIPPSAS